MSNSPPPGVKPADTPYTDQYPTESHPVETVDGIEANTVPTQQPFVQVPTTTTTDANQELMKNILKNQQLMQQQMMQQQLMQQQQMMQQQLIQQQQMMQQNQAVNGAKINYGTDNSKINNGTDYSKINYGRQVKQNQKIQSGISGTAISSENKNSNNPTTSIGGPNYGNINQTVNNINQHIENKTIVVGGTKVLEKEGKSFSLIIAIIVFIFNLVWPGTGTLIAACTINNGHLRGHFFCAAIYQIFLALIIIGWCVAFVTSCFFISAAISGVDLYDYYRKNHSKRSMY